MNLAKESFVKSEAPTEHEMTLEQAREALAEKKVNLESVRSKRRETHSQIQNYVEKIKAIDVEIQIIQKAVKELNEASATMIAVIGEANRRNTDLLGVETNLMIEISALEKEISNMENKPIVILMSSVKEPSKKKLGKMEFNLEKGNYSEITSENETIQLIAGLNWRDFPKFLKYVSWFNGFVEAMEPKKTYELYFSADEGNIMGIFASIILERGFEEYLDVLCINEKGEEDNTT